MFPSIDTNGYDLVDSFINPHHTTMVSSFTTHIQSPSSHHQHPLPSFPSSADFLDESVLISQFLLPQPDVEENVVDSPKKKNAKCVDGTTSEKVPRRRTEKKRDRHSKICTAQGPRDRRMRLSLQIARKFFDLQDMLGFDKASKTIEWLISKSKASIKQVKESVAASGGERDQVGEKTKDETFKVSKRVAKTVESSCKKKESREKARERARERTMTKMKMRLSGKIDTSKTLSDPHQESVSLKLAGGAQVLEGGKQDLIQEQEWSNTNMNMEEYQMDSVSIIEKFLGLTSNSSSFSIFGDTEESYTSLSSIRGTTSAAGMVIPREHNTTSTASEDEERNPISSFSLDNYLCY